MNDPAPSRQSSDSTGGSKPAPSTLADLARLSGLGMTFALCIVLCGGGGWWLDEKIGTFPVFLSIGVFLGAAAGFVHIVRAVR